MCLAFNGRMKKLIRNYKFVYKKLIITSALFRFTGDMVVTGPLQAGTTVKPLQARNMNRRKKQ